MELPYYHTNPIPTFLGSEIPATSNFETVELFCLKTKLYPLIHGMFGTDKEISFQFIRKDDLMVATLVIFDGLQALTLTPVSYTHLTLPTTPYV